jgi:acyl carrier protein
MTDLEHRARKILGLQFKADPERLRPEDRLREDLGADSLDMIELLYEFEKAFDARIPDEQAVDIKTVGDVFGAIQKGRAP